MATSAGKTIALILLVVIILLLAWRLTPLCIAPLGIFTGTIKTLRTGLDSIHFWPYDFRLISLPFFSIGLLILWIVVIIWVYRDAERRGMNGLLWALLVLIGNLIGLLIYLIVRTDTVATSGVSQSTQTTQPSELPGACGPEFRLLSPLRYQTSRWLLSQVRRTSRSQLEAVPPLWRETDLA